MFWKKIQKFLLILLIINLLISQTYAARCGIYGNRGHNRRTCPTHMIHYGSIPYDRNYAMVPYNQNRALVPYRNPISFPQKSMFFSNKDNIMNNWKVPWATNVVIKTHPYHGRTCTRCGAMGHGKGKCPIPDANVNA
ncbi:24298_t:CDS:1 [Cetraspora pellucida]|uniref:24298_t:CDS:1 n=1 Tax=Cetraspora pellucida TaxID=1433469 RepID=A0A9N9KGN5_9GLOM|nr:24298_t:CDS:1 [Cetraspora pellucida]